MPEIYLKDNLKFLRKKNGESQASIASLVGKRTTAVSSWENGLSEPSLTDLGIISDYFGISIGEIIGQNMSIGNLISETSESKKHKKGNLIGNPIGNLNAVFEPISDKKLGYQKSQMPAVITVDSAGNEAIVHVPVKARAGYLIGYGDQEYIGGLQTYSLPGFNGKTYRSFEVEGVSMRPTLQPRDWVVGEWLESLSDIRENRVHIIVTKNDGILIKRVLNRISERGKLYLKSDTIQNRHDYPTLELDPADIAEIWYARVRFGSDFSEPSEIFRRIDDLEIEMMELKKRIP